MASKSHARILERDRDANLHNLLDELPEALVYVGSNLLAQVLDCHVRLQRTESCPRLVRQLLRRMLMRHR